MLLCNILGFLLLLVMQNLKKQMIGHIDGKLQDISIEFERKSEEKMIHSFSSEAHCKHLESWKFNSFFNTLKHLV